MYLKTKPRFSLLWNTETSRNSEEYTKPDNIDAPKIIKKETKFVKKTARQKWKPTYANYEHNSQHLCHFVLDSG